MQILTSNAMLNLKILSVRFLFWVTILVCLKELTRKRADRDFAAEVVSFYQKSKTNISWLDYFPNSVVNDSLPVCYHLSASFCYLVPCHCHTSSLAQLGPRTPHQIWLIPHQQNLRSEMQKVNSIVDDNVKQQLLSNESILNLKTG